MPYSDHFGQSFYQKMFQCRERRGEICGREPAVYVKEAMQVTAAGRSAIYVSRRRGSCQDYKKKTKKPELVLPKKVAASVFPVIAWFRDFDA